jgi:predicted lipoprotein with Yx(FWY)xxD motif
MTRSKTITVATVLALPVVAVALAGCGGGSGGSVSPPKTSSGQAATVGVVNTSLGKILVNSKGRTLYLFQKDTGPTSTCTGACATNWPRLLPKGKPTIGSGANASLVGTSTRPDGKTQVTYNGHPVYLFSGDTKAGDTNGEGINAFGASWYALSSAGNKVTGSSNSGGSGYGYG